MVDFQSRDTRRGPTSEDDDGESEPPATEESDETDEVGIEEPSPSETGPTGENSATEAEAEGEQSVTESPADGVAGTETDDDAENAQATPTDSERGTEMTASTDDPLAEPTGEAVEPADEPSDAAEKQAQQTEPLEEGHEQAQPTDSADEPTAGTTPSGETTASTPGQSIDVAVVTVGADGNETTEDAVVTAFESVGHAITVRERLRGEYDTLQRVVDTLVSRDDVDVVVTTGGIGIDADEVTIEAVHPLFEKALPGFGEAFRTLLFDRIGTGIVAVRSTAGVADGTFVFCLPGGAEAAQLAVEEIIATEAPELVAHLQ